jgi:hypothetical protein
MDAVKVAGFVTTGIWDDVGTVMRLMARDITNTNTIASTMEKKKPIAAV